MLDEVEIQAELFRPFDIAFHVVDEENLTGLNAQHDFFRHFKGSLINFPLRFHGPDFVAENVIGRKAFQNERKLLRGQLIIEFIFKAGLAFLVISAADYGVTKWKFLKDQKMSFKAEASEAGSGCLPMRRQNVS